ncbi:ABC transporter substrate-binding protein [Streptomyces agglomeratus]|uniref:ABC transporter substrate-binding protein n=1 Tax=Streptomyces agglomeratus TaxID=285458 RepID=UPI000854795C|nr:ABC transporter substrate-binding protein [Streptomyces agglomeratus]OEJ39140.1 ABC transporter substrate-binding protein [Streptomyces agglomeratus]OEJ46478.1 ABC transporter substrate-binding protein [Streptomyces agglomeratus]OEJ59067.1 ABC transporter substrate-binding protein [Streptomyces agglomeratus]
MTAAEAIWQFSDDRGQVLSASRWPTRIVAYIQAGATLWDHGLLPLGVFGSYHDGDAPDRAKSGHLPFGEVTYFGAGASFDPGRLLSSGADLVVAVSYKNGQVYGIDPDAAKRLEEQVPVVVLDVGQDRSLDAIRGRFAALAASLGGAEPPVSLDAARERLRTAATDDAPRVLALSAAGGDQVHLARPHSWPDLRALAELGVRLVEPPTGAGANWSTVTWTEARSLAPEVVLADTRANAAPLEAARLGSARVIPWNPELPASSAAHARFFTRTAQALKPH